MKSQKTYMQVVSPKVLKPVVRATIKGQSDYANHMHRKYGVDTVIEQFHFNDNLEIVIDCTWGE